MPYQQLLQANPDEQGRLLYDLALQELDAINQNHQRSHGPKSGRPKWYSIKAMVSGKLWKVNESQSTSRNAERLEAAIKLLKKASESYSNLDAQLLLADMNFFGDYGHHRDLDTAASYYQRLADMGDPTAQHMLGFFYATGLGNIQRDLAKSLLYHTFAAHGGNTESEMTLGYRYFLGIGTEQKCEDAMYYYKHVAKKAIDYYLSGPPGGYSVPLPKIRLPDEVGGVYGYGASAMTERRYRQHGPENSVSIEEVLQYYRYVAHTKSDLEIQLMLGQVYYEGTRAVKRDFNEARRYFEEIVDKIPPNNKMTEAFMVSRRGRIIGHAAGYLGRMFWRGESVKADSKIAYKWFSVGAKLNDSIALNGLGMMYRDGEVVSQNLDTAIKYFARSSNQNNPDSQVNLGIEYIKHEHTLQLGVQLFGLAAESRHLLAYWYLGQLHEDGIGVQPKCEAAVAYYKMIAERGDWELPSIEEAHDAYSQGDIETALLHYMLAAERGYEVAQANVAYILDTDKHMLKALPMLDHGAPKRDPQDEERALIYWTRSANQNNVDSRVKMCDYYFKGIGAPVDYEKAAECYRIAAESEMSSLAMWNLGWMYENGVGVTKDFHMARRAYESALRVNPDAYFPIKVSLFKLYMKYYWDWLSGNSPPGQFDERTTEESYWNQPSGEKEGINRMEIDSHDGESSGSRNTLALDDELRRKYTRHKKQVEHGDPNEREESYTDDIEEDEVFEDELTENLLIVCLCILVGWLVYVRQFRFGNNNTGNNVNNNNNRGNNDNTDGHTEGLQSASMQTAYPQHRHHEHGDTSNTQHEET